jgi:hypothetical protein
VRGADQVPKWTLPLRQLSDVLVADPAEVPA